MDINDYINIFWGENSLNYSFEDLGVWDSEKYWILELYLIKLCKYLDNKGDIKKDLAKNIFFLSHSINNTIIANRELEFRYLENYNEAEADYCLDRFNHLMRILWNAGNYTYENSIERFREDNPKYS